MALVFVQFIHTLLFYFSGTASKLFYSIFLEKDLQVELLEIISMTAKLEKNSTLEAMESLDSWPKEIEASTSNG